MAEAAVMRTFLEGVINVSAITTRCITDQGLDDFSVIVDLNEEDMKTLCNNMRRPGGTIINPQADVAGQPPNTHNPGNLICMVAEKCLILTVYATKHQTGISRPVDVSTMTCLYITDLTSLLTHWYVSSTKLATSGSRGPVPWGSVWRIRTLDLKYLEWVGETKKELAAVICSLVHFPKE